VLTYQDSENNFRVAKNAHELFTINLMIVHLFLALGLNKLFAVDMNTSIASSIAISLVVILFTYFKTKQLKDSDQEFDYLNWQLSLNRYKMLIGAYIFFFLSMFMGIFTSSGGSNSMDGHSISEAIFLLLGIVPLFIVILIGIIIGSGSIYSAGKGEITKKFAEKYLQ